MADAANSNPDIASSPGPQRTALLEVFLRHQVRFVVIGGAAIQSHGGHYVTQDIDLAPDTEDGNLDRLAAALNELACRLAINPENPADWVPLPPGYFTSKALKAATVWNVSTRHGLLDLTFTPSAFPRGYADLLPRALPLAVAGTTVVVPVASLDDVHASKRAADRPKDRAYLLATEDSGSA